MQQDQQTQALAQVVTPLQGQGATIIPWTRGLSARDEVLRYWLLAEREQSHKYIFWADYGAPALLGDPVTFCAAFSQRACFSVYDHTTQELVGVTWVEKIVPWHSAHYGMFFARRAWGALAREATRLTVAKVFEVLPQMPQLFGLTPWKTALRHGLATGWAHVATLPGFAAMRDRTARDLYVLRIANHRGGP